MLVTPSHFPTVKPAGEKRWQQQYRDHDYGRHSGGLCLTALVYCFTIWAIFFNNREETESEKD